MASDYDDERAGRNDREDGDGPPSNRVITKARAKVSAPAILLIVTGAIGLVLAVVNLVQMAGVEGKFNEAIEKVEKDPNIPADQKKQQVELFTKVRDIMVPFGLPLYATNAIVSLIVIFAGVKMRTLSGRGLAMFGSLLAMVPLVNGCCCILGLPVGIWALLALNNSDVKAGFDAVARGSQDGY